MKTGIKYFIYKRIRIWNMGGNVYHLLIGKDTVIHTIYDGGINEITDEIDAIIALLKGGIK